MRKWCFVAVVLLAVVALPVGAEAQAKKGDKEVLIAGNLFSTLGGDVTVSSGNVMAGLGVFVTDRVQLAVQPILTISMFETPTFNSRGQQIGSDSELTTDIGLSSKMLLFMGASDGRVKPYIGGNFIVSDLKNSGDTSFVAGIFGIKNYISEKTAFDINGSYGFNLKEASASQLLQATVGLTFLF